MPIPSDVPIARSRPSRTARRVLALLAGAVIALAVAGVNAPTATADTSYKVLVFSKTAGSRHDSIPQGVAAVAALGGANNFTVDTTEDAGAFTATNLAQYRAVIWLLTTGDVLDADQQAAFEGYVRGGGGYVGVHAAADTEYSWPWYGRLVGAYAAGHPAVQQGTIHVEDRAHASTAHLGATWVRTDEWYDYTLDPRSDVHVLATLDESSYSGGTMGADHPIAWCHAYDGGRSWYTGGGHTAESYAEPAFRAHLLGGIRYAAGVAKADCRPESGYTSLFDGTSTGGWTQSGPGGFTLDDGTLTSSGGLGMLWYSGKEFGRYSLKLDWKVAGDDNSGVLVGFPAPGDDPYVAVNQGYEIQIDATDQPDRTTGAIYGFQAADLAVRDGALNPPGEWNTYQITVEGQVLTVDLNGVRINRFTNSDPVRDLGQGYIGIQNHGGDDHVSFRNVRIKELAAQGGTTTAVREGENFDVTSGVSPFDKAGASGGRVAGFIGAGDWIGFDGVDLSAATSITARVFPGQVGGTIEYRAGSATGTLLGSVHVDRTGTWDTPVDVTAAVTASSATSLYLVFTGGDGAFFDVDTVTVTSGTLLRPDVDEGASG